MGNIATDVCVEQVKATGNENLSRGETKAPEMRTFKVEGAKGEMYMQYTAAAGISGKEYSDLDSDKESRGKMITTATFYDDYGLFMYEYTYSDTWTNYTVSSAALPIVINERVMKAKSWKTNEYWPGSGSRLALYGYAPYNANGVTNLPTASTAGKPTFHYVVPTEAVDQKDLLVSEDDQYVSPTNINGSVDVPGNYNAIKTLKFKHACTAVRLAVGTQMAPCTIKKIAIKGVYGEADYNYGSGTGLNQGAWENYASTTSDYSLTADFPVSATDQNKVINSGKYTFMLLPQLVPAGAYIEITIDDGEVHVLKANIAGSDWKMGYSVTYFLTTSSVNEEYQLILETSEDPVSMAGESRTINIKSYRQTFYGSQVAIPWTLSYNYEDENLGNSGWLSSINDVVKGANFSGDGGSAGEDNVIEVSNQVERSKTWRSSHTKTLRAATQQGTESFPVDLSEGKRTANCYVVSAPGYYKFPLVYGNARNADGSANSVSYSSDTFVDHQGVHITSPYIYETNGGANVPDDAFVVWQDAPHLVDPSSVKLSDDKHYIEFQVEQKNICQGNSVLAVCDKNGTIMWSWHIWVTDHNISNTIRVYNKADVGGSVISDFMEVPLGFCAEEVRVRDSRIFNFKVVQSEAGGKTATISLNQLNADSLYTYGNNAPYYQWGRKDPMLPSNGVENVDKPFYDKLRPWLITISQVSTATAIQNPFTLYYKAEEDWSTSHNFDYWNINFTDAVGINNDETIKTIYDPSISDFTLPKTAAFTGFTSTGNKVSDISKFNVYGGFDKGWNFYTNGWKTGSTFFIPCLGYRDTYIETKGTGKIVLVNEHTIFPSVGASSTIKERGFDFDTGAVRAQDQTIRSCGMITLMVKE